MAVFSCWPFPDSTATVFNDSNIQGRNIRNDTTKYLRPKAIIVLFKEKINQKKKQTIIKGVYLPVNKQGDINGSRRPSTVWEINISE